MTLDILLMCSLAKKKSYKRDGCLHGTIKSFDYKRVFLYISEFFSFFMRKLLVCLCETKKTFGCHFVTAELSFNRDCRNEMLKGAN